MRRLVLYAPVVLIVFAGFDVFHTQTDPTFIQKSWVVKNLINLLYACYWTFIIPFIVAMFSLTPIVYLYVFKEKREISLRQCFDYIVYQSFTVMILVAVIGRLLSEFGIIVDLVGISLWLSSLLPDWLLPDGFSNIYERLDSLVLATTLPGFALVAIFIAPPVFALVMAAWLTNGRWFYVVGLLWISIFSVIILITLYFKKARVIFTLIFDVFAFFFAVYLWFLWPVFVLTLFYRWWWRRALKGKTLVAWVYKRVQQARKGSAVG